MVQPTDSHYHHAQERLTAIPIHEVSSHPSLVQRFQRRSCSLGTLLGEALETNSILTTLYSFRVLGGGLHRLPERRSSDRDGPGSQSRHLRALRHDLPDLAEQLFGARPEPLSAV